MTAGYVCVLSSQNCANCDTHPMAFDPPGGIVGVNGNRFCGEDCAAEYERHAAVDQARRDAYWCPTCGFDRGEHADDCPRDLRAWRTHAACRGMDPNIFHSADDEAYAKSICSPCPVRETCLSWALRNLHGKDDDGVWGGMNVAERRRVKRRRR